MDKETSLKIEDLKDRIEERISNQSLENENFELNANTLQSILYEAMSKYNAILIDRVEKNIKVLNRIIRRRRIFNRRIPYISSITPSIDDKGNEELVVVFSHDNNCKGIAHIQKDMTIIFDFMRENYSKTSTVEVLKKNHINFITYFNALDSFNLEYPGINYSWGKEGKCDNKVVHLDDGFVNVCFNLDEIENPRVDLSKLEDMQIASINGPKYGELYDYLDFYKYRFLKTFEVNKDDLNPLFKRILEKAKTEDKLPRRVLKVK